MSCLLFGLYFGRGHEWECVCLDVLLIKLYGLGD